MFSKILDNLLHERKVTKSAFCKYLGISRTTLDDYLNGITFMPGDKIEKTAAFFGVTVGYLFGETPSDTTKQVHEMLTNQQIQLTEIADLLKKLVQ